MTQTPTCADLLAEWRELRQQQLTESQPGITPRARTTPFSFPRASEIARRLASVEGAMARAGCPPPRA